ncbi:MULTISPECIES: resolvase [Paracoccus]|uniref:Uncharacterized protein n=1 Tax=Paracoccus versutus TaxID=34007 RepID=A0A3D9XHG3_PARVE|nr:resolvase [Paracoccus versutus]REF69946.1 hypothetical protein BDD41_2665 [Paracoccus versutus]WGR57708.1 resolvase [Paracoccus versutus]
MSGEVFDLFGNPVRPGKGQKGRPPFEVTDKDRNKVKLLLAMGWSNQRVANAIGVSLATLKRYFRAELTVRDQMRDRLEARRLELAMDLANAGNTAGMRELDRLIMKNDQKLAAAKMTQADEAEREEERPTSRYVGKGEISRKRANALAAGETQSEWGSLLKPGSYEN